MRISGAIFVGSIGRARMRASRFAESHLTHGLSAIAWRSSGAKARAVYDPRPAF